MLYHIDYFFSKSHYSHLQRSQIKIINYNQIWSVGKVFKFLALPVQAWGCLKVLEKQEESVSQPANHDAVCKTFGLETNPLISCQSEDKWIQIREINSNIEDQSFKLKTKSVFLKTSSFILETNTVISKHYKINHKYSVILETAGISGNHFQNFETGTGKPKNLSWCLGRERDIQETIPVVWDGNGKTQISFPLYRMGTGNLKVL